ncbi:hypothetical protein [Listeria innocua]|uniref:hypothetical protein n=1 Tax=Listeria innocua TaxID=1642 RepID=UPI00162895C5|nr:hypothetical protein [Listeria innocua]MBC1385550.1 glycosyltransferase family 1 protein [Listeria innocua]
MKKTAVFLSGCFLSHIIPIKPLVKALQRNGYSILILNTIEHKGLIESYDAQFIEYPCEIDKIKYDDILSCYLSRLKQAQQEENVQLYYELITKIGSIRVNNFENKTADLLMKKIRGIQPTIIFSDAINIYGDYISKKLNIECVGYITNNIYNEKFLTTKNGYLWKTFSRSWGVSHLYPESFFIEYWDYLNQVYREVATENSIPYVPPMVHFEPKGQKKIVFTSQFLQPKRAIANEKNYFFIPKKFERDKPASVSKRLKCFLSTRNKIVYIAHGSYLDVNLNYYIPLIQLLVKKDIKIVISTGKNKKDFLNKLSSIPTKKN